MADESTGLPSLHSPATVRGILTRFGLRADKGFGQNFLIDGNILRAIVEAADLTRADTAFEVGPGLGVLTRELVARAGKVVSVELDARLLPVLRETVGEAANLELVHGDALQFDLDVLPHGTCMVANLPYNVATPLVVRALESGRFTRLVFLVQREVAQRMAAAAGDDAFGALSLVVRHYGRVRRVRDVPPGAFYPPPDVTSSVVRIDVDPDARPDEATFGLIRQAFAHRRKTLKKNLLMAGRDPELVRSALRALDLDDRIRAERLDLATFRALVDELQS